MVTNGMTNSMTASRKSMTRFVSGGTSVPGCPIPLSPPVTSIYACRQAPQRLPTSASGILNRHRWLSSRLSRRDVKDIRRIMKASPSPISQIIGCFAPVRCVSRIDPRVAAPHKLLRPYYISRSVGSRERHSLSGQRG